MSASSSARFGAGFVDQATLSVQAGRGGNGCRSFYKDLWTRYPHPDGGDGGRGGDVLFRGNPQLTTLLDFQTRRHFRGGPGGHGSSKGKQGAQGMEIVIDLPLGTVVRDADTREIIRELLRAEEEIVAARGGAGGIGNARQAKSSRSMDKRKGGRARFDPHLLPGQPGEEHRLHLELKLVADVGLIGMPNAGKSSLLSKISEARPKIAAFPFTTIHPILGAVSMSDNQRCVAVDVPGLIEGAHRGKGLGLAFLRHIERTRLLVQVIDMAGADGRDPVEDYRILLEELRAYRPDLIKKPRIVAANKMDLETARKQLKRFKQQVKERPIVEIAASTGKGLPELLKQVNSRLSRLHE